jgi:Tol biopolymer transport system component
MRAAATFKSPSLHCRLTYMIGGIITTSGDHIRAVLLVLSNVANALVYDPAWSPRGEQIAFVGTMSNGDEIYTISPNGGDPSRLTFNSWEWDKHPTWSPDGTQIAFFSNRETGRRQIWVMNADGSNQRNLSNSEFEDWDPVWVR